MTDYNSGVTEAVIQGKIRYFTNTNIIEGKLQANQ